MSWNKMKIQGMKLDTDFVRNVKHYLEQSKVLYIGFGEGQNLNWLNKEGYDVYGTEKAQSRLTHAKKNLVNMSSSQLKLVKGEKLPFKNQEFDAVIAWQSMYYTDVPVMLDEVWRVLKPFGKFLSSMVDPRQTKLCHTYIKENLYRPSPETGQEDEIIWALKRKNIKPLYEGYGKLARFSNFKLGYYTSKTDTVKYHHTIFCTKQQVMFGEPTDEYN